MIITISRQFGSSGRKLAKILAEKLGYSYYDKEILQEIAKQSSLDETYVEKILNTPQTFLYSTGCTLSYSLMRKHTSDIFSIQQKIFNTLAEKGNAIFVGRGAEVLLNNYNPFKIFVYSTLDKRLQRVLENAKPTENTNPKVMLKKIKNIDKARIKTCSLLGFKWGRKENYDLCVSTEKICPEDLADVLCDYIKKLKTE